VFFSTKNNLKAVYKPSRNASLIYPHAILVVGYNTNSRYWIAKNSWGRGWADGGFFKVSSRV
jgi:C1A family cysteine protease